MFQSPIKYLLVLICMLSSLAHSFPYAEGSEHCVAPSSLSPYHQTLARILKALGKEAESKTLDGAFLVHACACLETTKKWFGRSNEMLKVKILGLHYPECRTLPDEWNCECFEPEMYTYINQHIARPWDPLGKGIIVQVTLDTNIQSKEQDEKRRLQAEIRKQLDENRIFSFLHTNRGPTGLHKIRRASAFPKAK